MLNCYTLFTLLFCIAVPTIAKYGINYVGVETKFLVGSVMENH